MKKAFKKRLDLLLFERKLTDSREKAQALIMAGQVLVDDKKETKPGSKFDEDAKIGILETSKYVGRGAEKLEAAAKAFKLNFKNKIVADIGSSTGGFTDFALQNGAEKVYAIDVGKGQLDWRLRNDPRVVVMEGVNFRYLESLPEKIDLFVIDVSFISLKKILPVIKNIVHSGSTQEHGANAPEIVILFKPQFEAGKSIVDKIKGVIKDPKIHQKLLEDFRKWCEENGFEVLGEVESPILGAKGNKEFLFNLKFKMLPCYYMLEK
ncbi:MAG: TlyA family RNA methyltransferase [Patescibacteria group bacterium]|nr:TlyA family RNA methyltransferase [Patescibacteria group bacterium]